MRLILWRINPLTGFLVSCRLGGFFLFYQRNLLFLLPRKQKTPGLFPDEKGRAAYSYTFFMHDLLTKVSYPSITFSADS